MAAVKNHFLPLFCLEMDIEPMKFAKNGDKYCLIVPQQADKCTCSNSRWLPFQNGRREKSLFTFILPEDGH